MPNRKPIGVMRRLRCEQCRMRKTLCVCAEIPRLSLRTRLVVLMHYREEQIATNSARLALAALTNSEVRLRGQRERPLATADLERPGALLLFPSEDARELDESLAGELRASGAAPWLIVPDGNWLQARKMVKREPVLARLPRVKLPQGNGTPSRYVRREPNLEAVSTLEAVARALGVLESAEAQAALERIFDIMCERVRWSRGELDFAQCRYPVPLAALKEAFDAGCRGGALSGRPRNEKRDATRRMRAALDASLPD